MLSLEQCLPRLVQELLTSNALKNAVFKDHKVVLVQVNRTDASVGYGLL